MLDGRKWAILEAIVKEHILKAEPIGSRSLTRHYDFGVSSATVRNEMADLEAMGFLEQPHTSAGRVPSDKGYRVFVDYLMQSDELPNISKDLNKIFIHKQKQIHELIKETTQLLSQATHYISMGVAPDFQQTVFQHIQLIPLAGKRVVAVLVTDSGMVHNQMFTVPKPMNRAELAQISNFLNDRLQGMTLEEISPIIMKELEQQLVNQNILTDVVGLIYEEILGDIDKNLQQIFLDGTSHIIDQPEFADLDKLKSMMSTLEQQDILYNILNQSNKDFQITIGGENSQEEMKDCSIVAATYYINGRSIGKIGILGPTRMEYGKVIAMVQHVTKILSKLLSDGKD